MKIFFLLSLALCANCLAADPRASDYLKGAVTRDVNSAITKAKTEGKPVYIVAWDDTVKVEPRAENPAKEYLSFFFRRSETQKLVSDNFVQVFTTMSNPALSDWLDKEDKSHIPVFIILGKNGEFVVRKHVRGAPDTALKTTQEAVAMVK